MTDELLDLLARFEERSLKERQLFLFGILTHGFIEKEINGRGKKKELSFLLPGVTDSENKPIQLCGNGIRNIFCIGTKQWLKLSKDSMLPKAKNIDNYRNNKNRLKECSQDAIDFLTDIGEDEGESHATRFVRLDTQVDVRDIDVELIQLPPYCTKSQLYERYCFQNGWITKAIAKGA